MGYIMNVAYILIPLIVLAVAGAAFFLVKRKPSSSSPQPVATGNTGWMWSHSPNMGPVTQDGEWTTFQFVPSGEADMLLRKTGPLAGRVRFKWKCDGAVKPVQGMVPTVSLIIVRRGNDWTAKNPNERFYWAGRPITPGGDVEVPFSSFAWRNVYGQADEPGFADILANAEFVGLAFGDPGAGATAHGVTGTGKFSFMFEVVA